MIWSLTPFTSRVPTHSGIDPFATLQREMGRMLEDTWSRQSAVEKSLRLDVKEDDKAFHVTADLPGLSEKEVDVTYDDGTLTIRGEKKIERDDKHETWHLFERYSGSFARQIVLPASIDSEAITARFDKGVLTVLLPKMPEERSKTKKIDVQAA